MYLLWDRETYGAGVELVVVVVLVVDELVVVDSVVVVVDVVLEEVVVEDVVLVVVDELVGDAPRFGHWSASAPQTPAFGFVVS